MDKCIYCNTEIQRDIGFMILSEVCDECEEKLYSNAEYTNKRKNNKRVTTQVSCPVVD
jgi:hypothetical protein